MNKGFWHFVTHDPPTVFLAGYLAALVTLNVLGLFIP